MTSKKMIEFWLSEIKKKEIERNKTIFNWRKLT